MKKISVKKAKARFSKRDDIELIEETYITWRRNKAKFWDKIEEDYFWAVPDNVYEKKSVHPKRAIKNRIKIRAVDYKKAKARFINRDDIELLEEGYVAFNKPAYFWDKKAQKKWKAVPDSVWRQKSNCPEAALKKRRNTCIKKYGVDNFTKSDFFKENYQYNNCTILLDNGIFFKKWYDEQPEPKPAYTTVINWFRGKEFKISLLKEFFVGYKNNKTKLELYCEELFETKHYNVTPNNNISYRPDFKLSPQTFVNVDGIWWHREEKVGRKYHYNIRKTFEDENLKIFQFYENEIYQKTNIVTSILKKSLNKTENKIFGWKCQVEKVKQKEAKQFLVQNHLLGSIKAKHIGLYYKNRLVSLMSWKCRKNVCKIERFCSLTDTVVIDAFSKLLNHVENEYLDDVTTEIHIWANLRYETGLHLKNKGFSLCKEILGWKWTDGKTTFNKLRSHAIINHKKLSQQHCGDKLGWYKIWDAGQRLWVKNRE